MNRAVKSLWFSVSVLLAVCLVPVLGENAEPPPKPKLLSKDKKEIKGLIKAYFKSSDGSGRAEVVSKLKAFDPIPASAVKFFAKQAFQYASMGTRLVLKHKTTLDTPDGTGTLFISGAKKKKLQPLLIGLHGGGQGAGDGANSEQKWQSAVGKGCICVFPTVIRKEGSAWNKEREEKYVLAIMEAVKRTCRVDTNRIYLVGHSMGGYGTWSIGGHFADLFAGLSPNAGGVFGHVSNGKLGLTKGVLPNLYNTPVYFFHSTDDPRVPAATDQMAAKELVRLKTEMGGGYEHIYKEYTDIGHGMPKDGVGPIFKYILAKRRDPYPAVVVFEPCRAYKRLFAWVEIPAGSSVRRIHAVLDRRANRVEVKTTGGDKGFCLYFQPKKMFNPKKAVVVTVNGRERFKGFLQDSVAALVHSIGQLNDPARYYTCRIDFP